MVIGTGIIGKGVLEKLLARKREVLWCYHNYIPELDDAMKGLVELCPLPDLYEKISGCDAVITATGSPSYILDEGHGAFFSGDKLTVMVDLSLPRNISSGLNKPEAGRQVVDLDDLKHWFRREIADMDRILKLNTDIIEENRDSYERISGSLQSRNAQQ